jgi:hypothetical protein
MAGWRWRMGPAQRFVGKPNPAAKRTDQASQRAESQGRKADVQPLKFLYNDNCRTRIQDDPERRQVVRGRISFTFSVAENSLAPLLAARMFQGSVPG